jgi:hypothetical protein
MAERFFAKARTADLIVQEMGPETLVFDRRTDIAHNLSPVASVVWNLCDGRHDVDAIVAAAAEVQPTDTELAVETALSDLTEKGLLETGVSRRDAVKKMTKFGAGAFAVPLVVSVMAPAAAMAGSGTGTLYAVCTTDSQCGLNLSCQGGHCYTTGQTCTVGSATSNFKPVGGNCDTGTNKSTCCSGACKAGNANFCAP